MRYLPFCFLSLALLACNAATVSEHRETADTASSTDAPSPEAPAPPVPVPVVAPQATSASAPIRVRAAGPDLLLGKFDPSSRPDFAAVGKPYSDKPGMYLQKQALEAFKKMWDAARKDGVTLKMISATRTFSQQKNIWEGKWARFAKEAPEPTARAKKIMEYSAMPGASRHHWGTDVDLNDLNNSAFETGGKYQKTYEWLVTHAHEHGFCQPYTAGRPSGYNEEKWHWSYTPLAQPFLAQYEKEVTDALLTGFKGAETALQIQVVKHYALGINTNCK